MCCLVPNIYKMTRKQYYTYRGLSGSEISRPDDLVDDAFITHVDALQKVMESMVEQFKGGINCISLK